MTLASLSVALRSAPPRALAACASLAAAFLALALLVAVGATRAVDLAVTSAFQSIASYPIDVAVNAHTLVGQLPVTLTASVVVALVAQRRLGGYAWIGPLLILATGAIELVFKYVAAHPGPPKELIRAFGNPLGLPSEWKPPYAFPSGHMARITFLSITLAALFPTRAAFGLAAVAIALSLFARVYIGDHWISDSLGGVALGASVAFAAVAWMRATARR
ncbi:MAG: phosphatase PAP2 family protein [Chloroflexi bacterium]|nr:phosphatase PAP2 family protein [Chloroflexota bacterium]